MGGSQPGGQAIGEAIARAHAGFDVRPRVALAGFGAPGRTSLFHAIFGGAWPRSELRDPSSGLVVDFAVKPERRVTSIEQIVELVGREDAVVHVMDARVGPVRGDVALHGALAGARVRVVHAVQKADLLDEEGRSRLSRGLRDAVGTDDVVWVSTVTGEGLPELVRRVHEALPEVGRDAFLAAQQPAPALRRRRARRLVLAKATLAAALSLGGSPDDEISAVQAALVARIALLHGLEPPPERVMEIVDALGAGAGIREVGRHLLRWVPGTSTIGAAQLFVDTVGLGEAATLWAQGRMRVDDAELRDAAKHAEARARQDWPMYASRARRLLARMQALRARLEAGEVSGADYDEEIARLGEVDDRRVQLASD